MDKSDRRKNILMSTALACGSFTSAYSVAVLPFFAVYCASRASVAVMACLIIACVVPFCLMPLVYVALHRFSPLLFGRYHLALPLSALLSALFFVLMYSATDGSPLSSSMIFFGAVLFSSALACYRYCSFSVRVRQGAEFGVPLAGKILAAFGAVAALACLFGFYRYDPETAFANTAYVLGALGCIFAMIQYLTTFYSVPKFSGSRKITVKQAFRAVYGGIDKKLFFGAVCAVGACFTSLGLSAYVCSSLGLSPEISICAAAAAACGYAAGAAACFKIRRSSIASAIAFVLSATAVGALMVAVIVQMPSSAAAGVISAACALCGGGLAAAVRAKSVRFVAVKPDNTVGTAFILTKLADLGGLAVTTAIAATCVSIVTRAGVMASDALVSAFAVAAALAVVGFALLLVGARNDGLAAETLPKEAERDDPASAEAGD